jgi:pimeloyl-ACP methyl ester carboxylesterase
MSTTPVEPTFLSVDGERIALRQHNGATPGVVWLGGFKSDMLGTKAERLSDWSREKGHAFCRHDYSGHGESSGRFVDGTISLWLSQSLAVFRERTVGPQILVGSSMGAWMALRMVQELQKAGQGARVAGLLLLAPAPDFTSDLMEPTFTDEQRRDLDEKGFFEEPSEYSPEPNVYTRALIEDGRANRVMIGRIDTHCPVHILQGMSDPDVPYTHALTLVEHLPADDVTVSLIRDGDHRLSRPQDLAMMISALEGLIERAGQA